LDLDRIWDYIAKDNIDAADQWIGKLFDALTPSATIPA
jgi:plasmid stabilization system protein ParE